MDFGLSLRTEIFYHFSLLVFYKIGLKLKQKIQKLERPTPKRIFIYSIILLLSAVLFLKVLHFQDIKNLNYVLAKVESQKITVDDLNFALGNPDEDEIQIKKLYNLDSLSKDKNFNCTPPFRYILYSRKVLIIFELKLEDSLSFYFENNGDFCFFERSGL